MTGNATDRIPDKTPDRLDLRGRLSDIAQIPVWIESLAARHAIPGDVQFAMNLCLEEAVSNIIRHGYGYGSETDHSVRLQFTTPSEGYYVFTVDDAAPLFNPLAAPELPALNPEEEIRIGGQGVRLLRRFAHTLEYEPTPTGNRLRIGFSKTESPR